MEKGCKILVTGGCGFIGTNLLESLRKEDCVLLNLDIKAPKIKQHLSFYKKVDLLNRDELINVVKEFLPDYVIHLAARTDLDGKCISDYDVNMKGVSNLLDALELVPNLKRAIFASSMYVCEPGYMPRSDDDYAPHTLYGESKVITETIIKEKAPHYVWAIIRPTSIWGPWFGEPYNRFFHIVLKHMYFHMGSRACNKTYGYVENAICQIKGLIEAEQEKVTQRTFYLGDYDPYNITEWANEIAKQEGIWIPRIPYFCFVIVGYIGDFLKKIGIPFPMTSFRLHNMTTDNVHDLNPIKEIVPQLPISRVQGTQRTLKWIHDVEK